MHIAPGIVDSQFKRKFNVKSIKQKHPEIHLPLFVWADARVRSVVVRRWTINARLEVTGVTSEVRA